MCVLIKSKYRKPTYEKNICIVKPHKIAVKDTTQSELMKRELESLRGQIKMAEKDVDLSQLSLNLHKKQVERVKEMKQKKVNQPQPQPKQKNNEAHIPDTENPTAQSEATHADISSNNPQLNRYAILASKKLSEQRNVSRVMAMDKIFNKAYISFKSSESTHDILKIDLTNIDQSEKISAHSSLIKDVQFSDNNDNLILSTSMDKTLKLISGKTNKVEQTMSLPLPGWSCSFNSVDPTKVYCGLGNSSILIYDARYPSQIFQKLESPHVYKTPIHSLFIDSRQRIFCSNLSQSLVWNADTNTFTVLNTDLNDYKPYSLSFVDGSKDTILLSSRNTTSTKHQHVNIDENYNTSIISTFDSPHPQKSLTRTFSFVPDTNSPMIFCYSDESNGMLRMNRSSQELQHFRIHSCPLDIKLYSERKPAFLTDNRLFLLDPKYN